MALAVYCTFGSSFEDRAKENCRRIHRLVGSEASCRNTHVGVILKDIANKIGFINELIPQMRKDTETPFHSAMCSAGNNLIRYMRGKGYRSKFDYFIGNRQMAFQYVFFANAGAYLNKHKKLDPMVRECLKTFGYYRKHTIEVMSELRQCGKVLSNIEGSIKTLEFWYKALDELTMLDLPYLTNLQREAYSVKGNREEKTFQDMVDEFINSTDINPN